MPKRNLMFQQELYSQEEERTSIWADERRNKKIRMWCSPEPSYERTKLISVKWTFSPKRGEQQRRDSSAGQQQLNEKAADAIEGGDLNYITFFSSRQ